MGFGNYTWNKDLIFCIKDAGSNESTLHIPVLNIPKSVSVLDVLPTLFWRTVKVLLGWTYLDAPLTSLLHSQSLVDLFGNREVFVSVWPSIGPYAIINDVIQAELNSFVEIIKGCMLLNTGLDVVSNLLTEKTLMTVVGNIDVDWCRLGKVSFLWTILGSGSSCGSNVVTYFHLWCWYCQFFCVR